MLKVVKEGRDGIYLTSKNAIREFVQSRGVKVLKCAAQRPDMTMGVQTDWEIETFNGFVDNAEKIAVVVPAQKIEKDAEQSYSIAIIFDKLYLFDVGTIEEQELEIEDTIHDIVIQTTKDVLVPESSQDDTEVGKHLNKERNGYLSDL